MDSAFRGVNIPVKLHDDGQSWNLGNTARTIDMSNMFRDYNRDKYLLDDPVETASINDINISIENGNIDFNCEDMFQQAVVRNLSVENIKVTSGSLDLVSMTVLENLELLTSNTSGLNLTNASVTGNLDLSGVYNESICDNMSVGGNLNLSGTYADFTSTNMSVGGNLNLSGTYADFTSTNMSVGGDVTLVGIDDGSLYFAKCVFENATVNGNLVLGEDGEPVWTSELNFKNSTVLGNVNVHISGISGQDPNVCNLEDLFHGATLELYQKKSQKVQKLMENQELL